jgi:hypothetical protein
MLDIGGDFESRIFVKVLRNLKELRASLCNTLKTAHQCWSFPGLQTRSWCASTRYHACTSDAKRGFCTKRRSDVRGKWEGLDNLKDPICLIAIINCLVMQGSMFLIEVL